MARRSTAGQDDSEGGRGRGSKPAAPRGRKGQTSGQGSTGAKKSANRPGASGTGSKKGLRGSSGARAASASAAEIMAAALADNGRAVVIGSGTLGKGLVQTVANLPDGSELFVTWSRVLAPLGWPIQGLGVMPQICTSLGAESLAQQLSSLARGQSRLAQSLTRQRAARAPLLPGTILRLRESCPAADGPEARNDPDFTTARTVLGDFRLFEAALLPAR